MTGAALRGRSAALLLSALVSLPAAAEAPGRACFWASQVTGFTDAGPGRTILNIGARQSWALTLAPGCSNVDWALSVGIRARGGGGRICSGRPAELVVPDASGRGARACLVRTIRRLSPHESAAARGLTPRR